MRTLQKAMVRRACVEYERGVCLHCMNSLVPGDGCVV